MSRFVAYREHTWLDAKADRAQWRQLIRAFGHENTDLQMITEWDDSIAGGLPVVLLDQEGTRPLNGFVHPAACCYVFGRTGMNHLMEEVPHDFSVCIDTPHPISLFGVTAAAIVLADREAKLQ